MEYWNDLITQKSWEVLQKLNNVKFTLIGGWAAYLWTKSHKSRDIDIIVDFDELEKIKHNFTLHKNDSLRKYEIKIDEIDIDIYVPFYSRLSLPVEFVMRHTTKIEGFRVVKPEILLILKQGAERDRKDSEKGLKDRIDIMALVCKVDIDFRAYGEILERYGLQQYKKEAISIIKGFKEIKYLGLNPREFKLKKAEIMHKMRY
ncbi:MAG TPA: hypothetical protein VJC16_04650 [Candidatus Nanoarchaeia archaeon]|nr:hypothetical protein [Candidatus Nanoarchaeia archaeon]